MTEQNTTNDVAQLNDNADSRQTAVVDFAAKPRYDALDGLRGVAAMLVVAYHMLEVVGNGDHTVQPLNHGYLAVDFFFVLSGFVIGYAYDDRWAKGMSVWGFFKRRLIRLHPLVILGTLFGAALFYFQDGAADWQGIAQVSPWRLIAVTLFCFTMIPCTKSMDIRGWEETNPLDGPVWSLQWEYLANILYGTIVRRFNAIALWLLVIVCGAMTVSLCLNFDFTGFLAAREYAKYTVIGGWSLAPDQLLIGFTRLMYPFFAGLLLSRLKWIIPVRRGGFLLCSILIVAALAMPFVGTKEYQLSNGIYEAAVILFVFPLIVSLGAGAGLSGEKPGKVCSFLGEISYPLYITHFPLICMLKSWHETHPDATSGQILTLCAGLFTLALVNAWAALKLYDLPIRTWLSRKYVTQRKNP